MKIGILTYHRANNVGAVLQNFALQKVLNTRYDAETVDYRCRVIESGNRILARRTVKEWAKFFLQMRNFIARENNFTVFRKKHLRISETVFNCKSKYSMNDQYDVLLTGSDQVWNMHLNGGDFTYMLDFASPRVRKASYAASMGYTEIPTEFRADSEKCLKRFDYISVREQSANQNLEKMGIQAAVVLDPTLLLTGEQWKSCMDLSQKVKEKYVFVYMVANTPDLLHAAKEYAKENQMDVYIMHYGYRRIYGMQNIRCAGPKEFLQYLYNAEMVFCSSFHAVCFSILFHKRFICALDASSENNNSRLLSLCSALGLNGCILSDEENRPPDYDRVDKEVAALREESIQELVKGVEGVK